MSKIISPSYRRVISRRYVLGRLLRYITAFFIVFALIFVVIGLSAKNKKLDTQLEKVQAGIYRTDDEILTGGKRFIDYLFSLNSASIEHDQFRAISMMIDKEKKREHMEYLKRNDIIRKVKLGHVRSEIDWNRAEIKILDKKNGIITVSYKTYIVVNFDKASPIHLILTLTPVQKVDNNTDGVGVMDWQDVAKKPLMDK